MKTRSMLVITIALLLCGLTAHAGNARRIPLPVARKTSQPQLIAYGPDILNGGYTAFSTAPVVAGETGAVTLPLVTDAERLSMLVWRGPTNLTGHTLWVGMYMTITSGMPPAYFLYQYQKSPPSVYTPANMRLFFSSSVGLFNAANAKATEGNEWWYTGSEGSWTFDYLELYGHQPWSASTTVAFDNPALWVNIRGVPANHDPRNLQKFREAIAHVQQYGLCIGGATQNVRDWWAGVFTDGPSDPIPECTLHIQVLEPFVAKSKTGR